jgi:hypothetical protein
MESHTHDEVRTMNTLRLLLCGVLTLESLGFVLDPLKRELKLLLMFLT